jgi:STE24 endopeptidase
LTPDEITGVLAHEIGHYKKGHIWKMFIIQTFISGLSLFFVKLFTEIPLFLQMFELTDTPYITKFIFSVIYINSFFWLLKFPVTLLSRKHEFDADTYSGKITGKPDFIIQALIKLIKDNMGNPYPAPLYSNLYYSHPPLSERITNLNKSKIH